MADYIVQKGETLSKIAAKHGMNVKKLASLNGITDVNKIYVGQTLVFEEAKTSAATTAKTETKPEVHDYTEEIKHMQKEIDALRNETLSDKAKKEIQAEVEKMKQTLINAGVKIKGEVQKKLDMFQNELIEAYQKGEEFAAEIKTKVRTEFNEFKEYAQEVYKNSLDATEQGLANVAEYGKRGARTLKKGLEFEIAPEKKAPDYSEMSQAEILQYQQKELEALKNRTLTDMVKESIQQTTNDVKKSHNALVGKVYDYAKSVYHTVADTVKGLFNWLRE